MAQGVPGDGLDSAGSAGRSGFDPAASAGLFVGVSTFEDERIVEVPYAVDDAVDLAHLFSLELKLVTPERVVLLLAGTPRKPESVARLEALHQSGARFATARQRDIYRHLAELVARVRPGGMALLSVATHGVSDAGGDFLVATDSLADRKLRTGVAAAEVFEEASRAGRGLVLLDACREQVLRARGEGAGAAMGEGFAEAIAKARGLVVLSGATLGGFAYDDPKRRNGVFTAAVLDGLNGGAAPGSGGWITVSTLAQFVQEQVVAWVRREWPGHAERSLGIGKRIEASAEGLPLAPHPSATREREGYRERRKKALAQVRELQGELLSGSHWDQVRALLPEDEPNVGAEKLLGLIEGLTISELSQLGLKAHLKEQVGNAMATLVVPKPVGPRPVELRLQPPLILATSPPAEVRKRTPPRRITGPGLEPEPRSPLGMKEAKELRRRKNPVRAIVAVAGVVALVVLGVVVWRPSRINHAMPVAPKTAARWENPLGMSFLYVPSGTYTIGSPKGEGAKDETVHEVKFTRGFWLGETEVTQAQWKRLVTRWEWWPWWKGWPWAFEDCGEDCPVENLTWYAAAAFANRLSVREGLTLCYQLDSDSCKGTLGSDFTCEDPLPPSLDCPGYRLPTEAEWEVAARAGRPTAEESDLASFAWFHENRGSSLHPVGKKQANPWGFRDILGNVSEWTGDWYGAYPAGPAVDPRGPNQGADRVIRGGSWSVVARIVRVAYRYRLTPSSRWGNLGFRLARSHGLRSSTSR